MDHNANTLAIYDRFAARYDFERGRRLFEKAWIDRTLRDVSQAGHVLDLGCGAGAPIGVYLSSRGVTVTGVDFAPSMLRLYASRLPKARVELADMTTLSLDQRFEAIIGWGSFFHLTPQAQRDCLPRLISHLAPGGRMLLTVGPSEGEVTGHVAEQPVYHASLAPETYAALTTASGAHVEAFVPNDPEAAGHTLLLIRRR